MNSNEVLSMHLSVIDNSDEIKRCQDELAGRLHQAGELKRGNYGHQGHSQDMDMYWLPEDKFWWGYQMAEGSRHWNAFGFAESFSDSKSFDITCEINFPLSKGTWCVAGAFARDENGETYIVHSGKIGGGRKGIGRGLFMEHFAGSQQWVVVERNGKSKEVVVVSSLDDDSLIQNLAHFVKEVYRIKKLPNEKKPPGGGLTPPSRSSGFRGEFEGGRKSYSADKEIRARVEHGKIVRSLHSLAVSMEIEAWNNQQTDLFLRRKTIAMVEVKASSDSQSRYTAIGQLLYHSRNDGTTLIAVFPSFEDRFRKVLKRLGIVGVTWFKSGHEYKFDRELDKILKRL